MADLPEIYRAIARDEQKESCEAAVLRIGTADCGLLIFLQRLLQLFKSPVIDGLQQLIERKQRRL